jgi:hypothetical protein
LFLSLSRILQNTKNKIHIDVQFKNTHAPEISIFSFLTSIVFFIIINLLLILLLLLQ